MSNHTYDVLKFDRPKILSAFILPERTKTYPLLSAWAKIKLLLLNDPNVFHSIMSPSDHKMADRLLTIYNRWAQINPKLNNLVVPTSFSELDYIARRMMNKQDAGTELVDEVLHILAKGSEQDVNFSHFGLPEYNDMRDRIMFSFSIDQAVDDFVMRNKEMMKTEKRTYGARFMTQDIIKDAIAAMSANDAMVQDAVINFCEQYARRIETPRGYLYMF